MDTAYYDNLWRANRSGRHNSETFWDGRAERFHANAYKEDGVERLNRLLSLLTGKGLLTKNSSILDIGCGPGKYAAEMAGLGKEVVGIDLSSKMLAYAESRQKEDRLENLRYMKLDWNQADLDDLGWVKRFDLVFASMCPAINSKQALDKMIRASKGYCFFSTFAQKQESIRDRLAEKLLPEWNFRGQWIGAYCCFNILWLGGYYPDVTYMDSQWENKFSFEEAVEYYCAALPVPGGLQGSQRDSIASCLRQISGSGTVTEQVKAKLAWMFWKV